MIQFLQRKEGISKAYLQLPAGLWVVYNFVFFFFLFPLQAPESYKNVTDVVNTCHDAGISKKAIKLRPIAVIKG